MNEFVFNERLTFLQHFSKVVPDTDCNLTSTSVTPSRILKTLQLGSSPLSNLTEVKLTTLFACRSPDDILRAYFATNKSCWIWIVLLVISLVVLLVVVGTWQRNRLEPLWKRGRDGMKGCDYRKCCTMAEVPETQ
jgi:hypothetical protein